MSADERLDSWKEIAAYLKRDVTTVRRWEKREGLPVHRHLHEHRDSVYAYTAEIDRWADGRCNHLTANGDSEGDGHHWRPSIAAIPWILAAVFLLTTLLLAALLIARQVDAPTRRSETLRFPLFAPKDTNFGSVSLSPDGRVLAFTAIPTRSASAKPLLWVRSLDSITARALPDTEHATLPFWSPDGAQLGFFASGKLWVTNIAGGSPRSIADARSGRGGTWNRDGVILFSPHRDGEILRVHASGGPVTPVTTIARPNERGHLWPEFLPDGTRFLFFADSNRPEHHNVFVARLGNADRHVVINRASSNAAYGDNDLLFFAVDRRLVAQRFDPRTATLTGEPVTIADRVNEQLDFDHKLDLAVAPTGVLAYRTMQSPASQLVWRDRLGPSRALLGAPAEYTEPALSPDETQVAVALFDPQPSKRFGYGLAAVRSDIWMFDATTASGVQLTTDPGADWGPVWSPDGDTIVFSSNRRGNLELFTKEIANPASIEVPLVTKGRNPVAQSWSPDGKVLLYSAFDDVTRGDLWLLPMTGDRTPVPLVRTPSVEEQGQISPDGRWFSYTSDESGTSEVYVQSFPQPHTRWKVSTGGGGDSRWRRDGKELFYVSHDRQLMAVPINTRLTFEHGAPVALFDVGVPPSWYEARNLYDVTRDGRFLFMQAIEDDRSMPFTIVLQWRPSAPLRASWSALR